MRSPSPARSPRRGECRRCLDPVVGALEIPLSEVFEARPIEGETYPLDGDEVDLEPVVRDAVLLHLPLAPLCRPTARAPRRRRSRPSSTRTARTTRLQRPRPTLAGPASTSSSSTDGFDSARAPPLRSPGCAAGPLASAPRSPCIEDHRHGRPQEEDLQGQEPEPPGQRLAPRGTLAQPVPRCGATKVPHVVCGDCGWYAGRQAVRGRLTP